MENGTSNFLRRVRRRLFKTHERESGDDFRNVLGSEHSDFLTTMSISSTKLRDQGREQLNHTLIQFSHKLQSLAEFIGEILSAE